jgi:tRNA U34 2-thiouridine synthase MnmA/TrmU
MKILLGISGGVDSAYAAYKLKSEGHEVEGAVIKMHCHTELDAAREEYARLLNVLAEAKSHAENAADRMYRAEKISVRDVIETDVKDPDFTYLNQYGALLSKAQADEQAALGELRRAQKNSDAV